MNSKNRNFKNLMSKELVPRKIQENKHVAFWMEKKLNMLDSEEKPTGDPLNPQGDMVLESTREK